MNDWNRNGEYDAADSFMDYNMANNNQTTDSSSDWWKWLLFAIAVGVCPPIGTLKKEESFKSWIFTILSNKCKAKMREYVNRPGELTEELADTLQAAEGVTAPEHLQLRERC